MDRDDQDADRIGGEDSAFHGDDPIANESGGGVELAWRKIDGRAPSVIGRTQAEIRPKRPPVLHHALPADRPTESVIVGSSRAARDLRERIRLYSDDLSPVLVTGETGVGKELVARELHRLSERRAKPFVPLNAGAIPEGVAATELFGHTKGAFTNAVGERDGAFQAADGGVLLIDEIGDMPASIQAQLLRVLDDGIVTRLGARTGAPVDIRLVTATNVDLRKNIAAGSFRRDLYHRITVLQIHVPPLRERGDDVIEIAEDIIARHPKAEYRRARLTPLAADRLRAYPFPGNVRELKNAIMRALVHAGGGKILAENLEFADAKAPAFDVSMLDISEAKELMGKLVVLKALKQTNGNVTRAAQLTGRTRSTFHMLKKQLDGEDFASEYEAVCARIRALLDAN